jgi:dipeptidase E
VRRQRWRALLVRRWRHRRVWRPTQASRRRPTYQRLVANGLASGFAADVGAALHFIDGTLAEVVTSRPPARAYKVERRCAGDVHEEPLPARDLGAPRP